MGRVLTEECVLSGRLLHGTTQVYGQPCSERLCFISFSVWFVFWFYFRTLFSWLISLTYSGGIFFFTDAISVLLILLGYVALPDMKHLRSLFETITKLHGRQAIKLIFTLY